MDNLSQTFITLGVLFLLGLATDSLGSRTPLPRATLLILFGFLISPSVLNLLPDITKTWFPLVANMALIMVGFLLGEKLTLSFFRRFGRVVIWVSFSEVFITALIVFTGMALIGIKLEVALLLAGISTATDPAATADVVHENKAIGPFTQTLLGVVAIDDGWGIMVFSIMFALAQSIAGHSEAWEIILHSGWEIGGAVLIGVGLGIPVAYLTGRVKPGEPTLAEALGIVFLCGGISIWLDVSFLLASMTLGMVVANLAKHHKRPFHEIEHIEWPFMILFFILAGASLDFEALLHAGVIGTSYVILRIAGRLIGGWAGGAFSHTDPKIRRWMGLALMPQAGVALGMALIASQQMPHLNNIIFPVVIGATIIFEIIGPVFTRFALSQAGEIPPNK